MKKFLDIYVPILISLSMGIFTYSSLVDSYSNMVIISFFCVIIGNLLLMRLLFRSKYGYFDAIFSIFYMLFYIVAPVIQLKDGYFPTPFTINDYYIILANICNFIFVISFILFRYTKIDKNTIKKSEIIYDFKLNKFTRIIMASLFFCYFIPNLPRLINQIIYRTEGNEDYNQVLFLITNKVIMMIPLLFVFYYIIQYKNYNNKKILNKIIFWIVILIICKNPFNEKRNAIAPVYLSFILFMMVNKYNARNFLLIITGLIIVAFPFTAIITHTQINLVELISNLGEYIRFEDIGEQFNQMHFDAFENLNVIIEYVKNYGITWGMQFIGAVLFFIPRSLWINKPLNTGFLIGEYLISNYGFHYNNLACPITAEAYVNGGIICVVVFAYIIAKWSKFVYKWLSYGNYYSLLAWYMVIHLFFLMRGDLMNAIAYLIGPLISLYFMPLILNNISYLFKRR